MRSLVHTVAFDCADPYALAEFWAHAVGAAIASHCRPGDGEVYVHTPGGQPGMRFRRVVESKTVKNRIHLDLGPEDGAGRDSEVERLLGLGATFLADLRTPDGAGFVVLADPEGNEFCVGRDHPR